MRRVELAVLMALTGGCAATSSERAATPLPPDEVKASLTCTETASCRPFAEEVASRCKTQGVTVRVKSCGAYRELTVETDPTSFVATSQQLFYDAGGALVCRKSFASEYGRTTIQGPEPSCLGAAPAVDPCGAGSSRRLPE